jgi:hypothetical protein
MGFDRLQRKSAGMKSLRITWQMIYIKLSLVIAAILIWIKECDCIEWDGWVIYVWWWLCGDLASEVHGRVA